MKTRLFFRGALRGFVVALLFVQTTWAHAADDAATPEQSVPGMEAQRIDEPVFQGHVVVYEAGRGNARSILLVHGIGTDGARDFREQIAWLRKSFHVVAVDLPGFGQSDKGNLLYSPTNYAEVLKYVADRFIGAPFVLIGHSMGAVVSLRYAATYPRDVERLVVIDAPGVLYRYSFASDYLAYLGLDFVPPVADPLGRLANIARKLLTPLERFNIDPQAVLDSPQLRETILDGDPAKIAGLAVVTEDLHLDLAKIAAETLVVWGSEDALAPLRTGKVLEQKLPRARLVVIDGAGHTPMLDTPGRFRAELEPFLEHGLPPAGAVAATRREQHGNGACRGSRARVFEGDYDKLTIEDCQSIEIRDARVGQLRIENSTVTIDDSSIVDGLYTRASTIVMTGGRVEGKVAIVANGSRLDLAGVEVRGSQAAVTAPRRSYVVFSLCRLDSPYTQGEVHEFFSVDPKNPL